MNDPAKNQGYFDLPALFFGSKRSGSKKNARAAQSGAFDPKAHYQNAWQILKKAPLLFALKLGAGLASGALWIGIALLVTLPLLLLVGRSLEGAVPGLRGVMATGAEFLSHLSHPLFILGFFGLLAGAWAMSLCTHAFASAGIWATLRRGVRQEQVFFNSEQNSLRGFLELLRGGVAYFPRVLRLQLMVACTRVILALLGILLVTGVLLATTRGVFAGSPVLVRAFLWAWPLTLLSGFAVLVRLSTEVAAASVILDDFPIGRALLRGATFVVHSFVPVYRLFLYGAKLFLLPLVFYWIVVIGQNMVFVFPSLGPLFAVLRVLAFIILFVASSIIAVFFKAAIFSYYESVQTGGFPDSIRFAANQMGTSQNHKTSHQSTLNSTQGSMPKPSSPARIKMTRETTLEEFLPGSYPNIIELSELIRAPEEYEEEPEDVQESEDVQSEPQIEEDGAPDEGEDSNTSSTVMGMPAPSKLSIPTPRDLSNNDISGADDDSNS